MGKLPEYKPRCPMTYWQESIKGRKGIPPVLSLQLTDGYAFCLVFWLVTLLCLFPSLFFSLRQGLTILPMVASNSRTQIILLLPPPMYVTGTTRHMPLHLALIMHFNFCKCNHQFWQRKCQQSNMPNELEF